MNFKIFVLLVLVTSCGVKGNPTAPKNASNPSLLQNYPDIQLDDTFRETKKK